MKILLCLLAALLCLPCPGLANDAGLPIELEFARAEAEDGQAGLRCAISVDIPQGSHAYAAGGGASGRPSTLDFQVEGIGQLAVRYPPGEKKPDALDPALESHVYEGRQIFFVALPERALGRHYSGALDMLLCSQVNCTPARRRFAGQIPQAIQPGARFIYLPPDDDMADPGPVPGVTSGDMPPAQDPAGNGPDAPPGLSGNSGAAPEATLPPEETGQEFSLKLTPRHASSGPEIRGVWEALAIGILAGLLLNAMPCVLPVLTLKVSGLLLLGDARPEAERRRNFRRHNFCFAAGILTLFTFLAIVLGAANLMWGQLFQNQGFLLIMLLLVFLLGLSMLGVFTLPALDIKAGLNAGSPGTSSYLSGLFATFLATPCSGPLLGGVLAWAFTQPLAVLLLVFWAVGIGMAAPYVLFAIWPGLARLLPRPGPWMNVFEHILGFCLLGTAIYLLAALPAEKYLHVLCVLLLASFCAWLWGRFCGLSAPAGRRQAVGALCALLLAGSIYWISRPVAPAPVWREFSPAMFEQSLGKRNLLLEFTADWCPNCKFMEAIVLSDGNLRRWKERYDMELVRVDLTRPDEYASRLLQALGSRSIPLTALFPAGEGAKSPFVLRDVYGADSLARALRENFSR